MFVGAPVVGISRVITTQQALNQECKTNYNFIQVALAGDNLARLCQIKNQSDSQFSIFLKNHQN